MPPSNPGRQDSAPPMSNAIIVSYDGTPNDDDALALGRMLARGGSPLALAYVRHSQEFDPGREQLAAHDANRRLEQGAAWLGDSTIPRHVVIHASTWEGLAQLAGSLDASIIVFGSDYRTPPGRVSPGTSAQHLLEGGPVAIAVAAAGIRSVSEPALATIAVGDDEPDAAALQTAESLAEKLGAVVSHDPDAQVDLLVIGARADTRAGRIQLSGLGRSRLASARGAVLVVPAGVPLAL